MKLKTAIYRRKSIPVRDYNRALNLFEIGKDRKLNRQWIRTWMPGLSPAAHKKLRDQALQMQEKAAKKWDSIAKKEFKRIFGWQMKPSDRQNSIWGRVDFSAKVKVELEKLKGKFNMYGKIAYAHDVMLPAAKQKFKD